MPDEEENPFLIKPKPQMSIAKDEPPVIETFDFLASPEEARKIHDRELSVDTAKPHYENAGTPIWDKKDVNVDNPDYEVVDHREKKEDEE
ncbi:MAG: hypothetical protein JW939_05550 [Candidatus Thermoplasmatota archaeon]|nr:hypothetical protein [Candidatus Thermoplasmatota archaeon]